MDLLVTNVGPIAPAEWRFAVGLLCFVPFLNQRRNKRRAIVRNCVWRCYCAWGVEMLKVRQRVALGVAWLCCKGWQNWPVRAMSRAAPQLLDQSAAIRHCGRWRCLR